MVNCFTSSLYSDVDIDRGFRFMAFVALVIIGEQSFCSYGSTWKALFAAFVYTCRMFAFVAAENLFSHGGEWQKIRTSNHE